MKNFKNPREEAFLALIFAQRGGYLEDFFQKTSLLKKDLSLAYEIAHGVQRRKLSLEFLADQLYISSQHTNKKDSKKSKSQKIKPKKLKLKTKERLLLYTALYQYFFMDRVPLYAVVDETVGLAKKYFHPRLGAFFNALLRALDKIDQKELSLPTGQSPSAKELSVYYSYSQFFVEKLLKQYDLEKTTNLLELMNKPAPLMARFRESIKEKENEDDVLKKKAISTTDLKAVFMGRLKVFQLEKGQELENYFKDSHFYIQNVTPVYLIEKLSENLSFKPANILDLCSAPGGKLLALRDLLPSAKLYANDVSEEKIKLLQENLEKYQITEATVSQGKAEEFCSSEKFDLIVLDVPCSNSGVLNKRAEARWRLEPQKLKELQKSQFQMLKHALSLLSDKGQIWYLTCSILKAENEDLVEKAQKELGLKVKGSFLQLPNSEGWDGGFGCSLSR